MSTPPGGMGLHIRSSRAAEGDEEEGAAEGTPRRVSMDWPRSWTDAAQWASRAPHVAGSLTASYIRTTHPHIMEAEHEEEAAAAAASPSRPAPANVQAFPLSDNDLAESLLYDYEEVGSPSGLRHRPSWAGGGWGEAEAHTRVESVVKTEACEFRVEEDVPTSTTWQASVNAANILCGVGLLATPYAAATSGLGSLGLLFLIGAAACYTGHMLAACMDACPGTRSYPDIGQRAFGTPGRVLVGVLLYLELLCCCIDFFILEGDNLSALFPGAGLSLGALGSLSSQQAMVLLSSLLVLPSVWLRDLSLLSFLSLGGIFASALLVGLLGWAGCAVTGFHHTHPPLLVVRGLPVAVGLYSFCFSGHAVFPSLYSSMRHKSRWGRLLLGSFGVVLLLYGGMALLGVVMFGPAVSQNVTLDMQQAAPTALPTRLAMWLVIVNPLTKLAMTLTPVAMAVEELIVLPRGSWAFAAASVALRTALLLLTAGVAVAVPFFAYISSFIGAFLSMTISIVLPCVFYLRLLGGRGALGWPQALLAGGVAVLGVAAGAMATLVSVRSILDKL